MFSSVNSRQFIKTALIYLFCSLFLILFNFIYGIFSRGVHSSFMTFAFLIPLIGGSVISLLFIFLPKPTFLIINLWRMGISTLVIGFLLRGVFDIYGTEVAYIMFYFYFSVGLFLISFILYVFMLILKYRK